MPARRVAAAPCRYYGRSSCGRSYEDKRAGLACLDRIYVAFSGLDVMWAIRFAELFYEGAHRGPAGNEPHGGTFDTCISPVHPHRSEPTAPIPPLKIPYSCLRPLRRFGSLVDWTVAIPRSCSRRALYSSVCRHVASRWRGRRRSARRGFARVEMSLQRAKAAVSRAFLAG
jgi:hypothetical protein